MTALDTQEVEQLIKADDPNLVATKCHELFMREDFPTAEKR
jgi:hypothetical protein